MQIESDTLEATSSPVEVRARQQWLLPPARPFVERFGHAFFRTLPQVPGVYLMRGTGGRPRRERVLYVGKARNLRQRLGSYRHVHPARDSRKTIRLVHAVQQISWEECTDETAALLRENELLREHRPLFNRVNVRPEAHGFIGVSSNGNILKLEVTSEPGDAGEWHGAFKGTRRLAMAALLRLLFQAGRPVTDWMALPRRLTHERAPACYEIELTDAPALHPLITGYLRGRNWRLVDRLAEQFAEQTAPPFLQLWREADLDLLRRFYLMGPRRNQRWRQALGLADDAVFRIEELDDLPVKLKLAQEASPWEEAKPLAGEAIANAAPADASSIAG